MDEEESEDNLQKFQSITLSDGTTIFVRLNDNSAGINLEGNNQVFQNFPMSLNHIGSGKPEEMVFEIIQQEPASVINDGHESDNIGSSSTNSQCIFLAPDYQYHVSNLSQTQHEANELSSFTTPLSSTVQYDSKNSNNSSGSRIEMYAVNTNCDLQTNDSTTTSTQGNVKSPEWVTSSTTNDTNNKEQSLVISLPTAPPVSSSIDLPHHSQTSPQTANSQPILITELSHPAQPDTETAVIEGGKVIKKTTVKAFVKMTVCRKITIEKREAESGMVLSVEERLEEEDPVILGVDQVETTEDLMSGNVTKQMGGAGSSRTSQGNSPSLRHGLSEVGERHPINSFSSNSNASAINLLNSSLLQSTLQKEITKAFQSTELTKQHSTNDCSDTDRGNLSKNRTKKDPDILTEEETVNELDGDQSEDYVPPGSTKRITASIKKEYFNPVVLEKANGENKNLAGINTSTSLLKKRGRKRKWDKTIGLVAKDKKCNFCSKGFDSVLKCINHMKDGKCLSSQFCFICSKTFECEAMLESHILSHRNSDKQQTSFNCFDCKRTYRSKVGYIKHFTMGTCQKREKFEDGETGLYSCAKCDSRFSTFDYLQLHNNKVHENPRDRHVCPECGKTFYSTQGYRRHRTGRPCTNPLKCHICGKIYKSKEKFKLHMSHHKSEASGITFNCEECSRTYMTEAALAKHKMLHTGVKPYKCETCGKEFAMRYQVKDHSRTHTGEKPFSCKLCNVAFSNKGHLGRHIRSHENGTLWKKGRPKKAIRSVQQTNDTEDTGSHKNSSHDNNSNTTNTNDGLAMTKTSNVLCLSPSQTINQLEGQMIQVEVLNGSMCGNQTAGHGQSPMIIQADGSAIIIADVESLVGGSSGNKIMTIASSCTPTSNSEVELRENRHLIDYNNTTTTTTSTSTSTTLGTSKS